MEKRKLQATGGASLTLTLPKPWVIKYGLQGKDEVIVIQDGDTLMVKPAVLSPVDSKVDINIDGLTEAWLVRELIATYISGADKITFRSQNISPEQRRIVQQALQLLFGFELLEDTNQKLYIKNIFDNDKLSTPQNTEKIFLLAKTMYLDALKSTATGDQNLALGVRQRDFDVNKLLYAMKRQYNSILVGKYSGSLAEIGYYVNVATQLERIADHAVQIAAITKPGLGQTFSYHDFPMIGARVQSLLDLTENIVTSLDKIQAHKILDYNDEFKHLITESGQTHKSSERVLIENSLDRLRGYLMNIAELTIDYSFISQP